MKGTKREKPAGSGRWECIVSIGKDPLDGKYKTVSRTYTCSAAEADTKLAELIAEVSFGKHDRWAVAGFSAGTTVAQLLDVWLESTVGRLRPSAVRNYRVQVDIIKGTPAVAQVRDWRGQVTTHGTSGRAGTKLAKMKAARVGPRDIDLCYQELTQQGLTVHQRVQVYKAISACFGQAMEWGWVTTRPTSRAKNPVPPKKKPKSLKKDAIRELLDYAETVDPDLADVMHLGYANGLRLGNLCGARWRDFAFEERLLTLGENHVPVDHVLHVGPTKGRQEGEAVDLYLTDETIDVLKRLAARQFARATDLGIALPVNGYLLSTDGVGDRPRHPTSVRNKMTRMAKQIGLHATPHMLRHSAGTHMFQAGMDMATVGRALGHKDDGETAAAFYNHTDEAAGRRAAGSLSFRPATIDAEEIPTPALTA